MLDEIDVASLVARIESEYREMPGLQLTARQMQRMWCLDGPTCEVIIGRLLAHRIVVKTRRDAYARADRKDNAAGASSPPLPPENERAPVRGRHDVDDAVSI